MKRAIMVSEREDGYVVVVNDGGFCLMCEHNKDYEWQTCVFKTYEEAERAKDEYNRFWSE